MVDEHEENDMKLVGLNKERIKKSLSAKACKISNKRELKSIDKEKRRLSRAQPIDDFLDALVNKFYQNESDRQSTESSENQVQSQLEKK